MTAARRGLDSLGAPSRRSAIIVRTTLPPGLESLRRRSVEDSAVGVPAHLTLLYPFVGEAGRSVELRTAIAEVVARHPAFDYVLAGPARWPDTIYAAVEPLEPFVRLQADLAAAFPGFPIYGPDWANEYVPHVTLAEGPAVNDPATIADGGWRALPARRRAAAVELIAAPPDDRWRTIWRIPLAGQGRSADGPLDRMRS